MKNEKMEVMLIKALADEIRVEIVEMLSERELRASDILEHFKIAQPTLSYHMKILTDSGLVEGRREGAWTHYTLKKERFECLCNLFKRICNSIGNDGG